MSTLTGLTSRTNKSLRFLCLSLPPITKKKPSRIVSVRRYLCRRPGAQFSLQVVFLCISPVATCSCSASRSIYAQRCWLSSYGGSLVGSTSSANLSLLALVPPALSSQLQTALQLLCLCGVPRSIHTIACLGCM